MIGYYVWAHVQSLVDKKQPNRMDSLNLAIRKRVGSIPLDMMQREIAGFARRVKKCIQEVGALQGSDIRGISEAAASIENQSIDEAGESAISATIQWI